MIKKLGVFCGSSFGNLPLYAKEAENLADVLSANDITLVYGGSVVGIMGVIANRMLKNGAKVIGVIPTSLIKLEIEHKELTELHVVNSMHERKALMVELSDGFITLPGGPGSMDEFFELFTWAKLGLHAKPYGILNIAGYYDYLLKFLNHSVQQGFLTQALLETIIVEQDPHSLINRFINYQPTENNWMNELQIATI